jgi:catechol 2,3-dioxygenase-like lactoylglutathione lyase family enzyme
MQTNRAFYGDVLGLPLEGDESYLSTHQLDGVKHFALWPLSGAAQSCFGADRWPDNLPVPQGWIEFDVEDIAAATAELENKGYRVLVANRQEPWGQTVTRLLGPDGLLVGITYTAHLR